MTIHRRIIAAFFCVLSLAPLVFAGDKHAPDWMQTLTSVQLPAYDEKTDAVLLYSEIHVTVLSADKLRTHVREAYKILRPSGRHYGTLEVEFNSQSKVNSIRAWCIPSQGADFEVNQKSVVEIALPDLDGSELISDVREKMLQIPAPEPGNIVGYEYETEEHPLFLQQQWHFQEQVPVREAHYVLQLPAGWEYRSTWLSHAEVKPTQSASNQLEWLVKDIPGMRKEARMPPFHGLAGELVISLYPAGGTAANSFSKWQDMGLWYKNLTGGSREASPEIKQKVAALTSGETSTLARVKTLSEFVQHQVRYVAIELGIGGFLPHPAGEVFRHHYGDCKDKATLLASMLHEIGIESYYFLVNTERGSITPETPAHSAFNHVILGIKLPKDLGGLAAPAMLATKYGDLLFFDPTDEMTPFGTLRGELQLNYGLLVGPDGGGLMAIPQFAPNSNRIDRTAKFTLDPSGRLQGHIDEYRVGDRAASERWRLRLVTRDADRIKALEKLLADSLPEFRITSASLVNQTSSELPFGWSYSFECQRYAKSAGSLLLFRPRVLGSKSSGVLETREPRNFAFEFEGPVRDSDTFEFTLPAGYEVDELPAPVDVNYSFGSYHAKTTAQGNTITYTRSFEIKELSVPVSKIPELKKFYRAISSDERNNVVLKPKS